MQDICPELVARLFAANDVAAKQQSLAPDPEMEIG
jgi:hypothetical protein